MNENKIPQNYLENIDTINPLISSKITFNNNNNNDNYNDNYNNNNNINYNYNNLPTFNNKYDFNNNNNNFNDTNSYNSKNSYNYNNSTTNDYDNYNNNNNNLLWKEIMRIPNNNINNYLPYYNNILGSNINANEINNLPEEYIINYIKILQEICKKELNEKEMIYNENLKLNEIINENEKNGMNENNIDFLNYLYNNKEKELNQYKNILEYNLKKITNNKNFINNFSENSDDENNNNNNKYYYCQYCSNKKFKNENDLEDHMRRRHLYKQKKY